MVMLAHQIRLDPNRRQEEYFRKACGISRFAWNWGLSEWKRRCESKEKVDGLRLKKDFNARKALEFPWTYEVTKYASQQPFLHLQAAFRRFFDKKGRYPRFKRKGVHDSFYIGGDHLEVRGKAIRIPRLGFVRMREEVRFRGKVVSATVRRIADKWFVSVQVELEEAPAPCESQAGVGVDLGVNRLATLSTGESFEGPKPLKKELSKLRRLSRALSRKEKGSKNRLKARVRLQRLHYRIRSIRQDSLHKLTTYLTRNFGAIAIEELNVKGMLSNRRLARAISDMGFHEFRRQVEYKAQLRRNHLEVVSRWFQSSKTCSECGAVKDNLSLSERRYQCTECGFEGDRDWNAARNLFRTVSSTGCQACGEEGSGFSPRWSETILEEAGTRP
jgi:putative transposase